MCSGPDGEREKESSSRGHEALEPHMGRRLDKYRVRRKIHNWLRKQVSTIWFYGGRHKQRKATSEPLQKPLVRCLRDFYDAFSNVVVVGRLISMKKAFPISWCSIEHEKRSIRSSSSSRLQFRQSFSAAVGVVHHSRHRHKVISSINKFRWNFSNHISKSASSSIIHDAAALCSVVHLPIGAKVKHKKKSYDTKHFSKKYFDVWQLNIFTAFTDRAQIFRIVWSFKIHLQ